MCLHWASQDVICPGDLGIDQAKEGLYLKEGSLASCHIPEIEFQTAMKERTKFSYFHSWKDFCDSCQDNPVSWKYNENLLREEAWQGWEWCTLCFWEKWTKHYISSWMCARISISKHEASYIFPYLPLNSGFLKYQSPVLCAAKIFSKSWTSSIGRMQPDLWEQIQWNPSDGDVSKQGDGEHDLELPGRSEVFSGAKLKECFTCFSKVKGHL